MLPSFDKLARMLTQEKRLGYKNKAVMGGLERLAPNWKSEADQEVTSDTLRLLVDEVVEWLQNYPTVTEEERPTYIHQLLVKLHRSDSDQQRDPERGPDLSQKTGPPLPEKPEMAGESRPMQPTPPAPDLSAKPEPPVKKSEAPVASLSPAKPRPASVRQPVSPAKVDSNPDLPKRA